MHNYRISVPAAKTDCALDLLADYLKAREQTTGTTICLADAQDGDYRKSKDLAFALACKIVAERGQPTPLPSKLYGSAGWGFCKWLYPSENGTTSGVISSVKDQSFELTKDTDTYGSTLRYTTEKETVSVPHHPAEVGLTRLFHDFSSFEKINPETIGSLKNIVTYDMALSLEQSTDFTPIDKKIETARAALQKTYEEADAQKQALFGSLRKRTHDFFDDTIDLGTLTTFLEKKKEDYKAFEVQKKKTEFAQRNELTSLKNSKETMPQRYDILLQVTASLAKETAFQNLHKKLNALAC